MSTMFRLIKLIIKEPLFILLSAFLGFLTIGSSIGLMTISALLISDAALRFGVADLMVAIVGVRFFGISRAVFRYLERYLTHSTTFKLLSKVRVWFYNRLEPLVPGAVDDVHSGDLFSRMVNDIESLKEFYLRVINPPVVGVLVLLFMCFFLNLFSPKLAIAIFIFFLLSGLVIPVLVGIIGRKSVEVKVKLKSDIDITMVDSFSGVTEILTFDLSGKFQEILKGFSSKLMKEQLRAGMLNGLSNALISISGSLCMWVALIICIPMVNSGGLKGDLLALIALGITSSFEALQPMSQIFSKLEESRSAAKRLFEITDRKTAVYFEASNLKVPKGNEISIKDLCVRYSSDSELILSNIDLELKEGKKLAIVGPNGSGKSTLAQVLLGFKDYERGSIILGDTNIKALDSDILMEKFSVVPQNPYMFNTTILENLKLSNLEASKELITKCLKSAQILEFIATLPMGLDTYIGEGGFKLSGGQRQRLAIARAFLRDKPILILDEPTTGLDLAAEKKLLVSLQEEWDKKSVVLITHKFFGLEAMDEILVLKKGRIIERGNHLSLMEMEGAYWSMWQIEKNSNHPFYL